MEREGVSHTDTLPAGHVGPGTAEPSDERREIGRFQLRRLLGRGGMGSVYLAWDPELDREVAVKVVEAPGDGSTAAGEERERLSREARAVAQVKHPNVVTVHEAGSDGGEVYLAMEVARGGNLRQLVARLRQKKGGWKAIIGAFAAAGRGLHAAHRRGLIHRDFKPENVLLDQNGVPKVADFGLARPTDREEEVPTTLATLPASLQNRMTEASTVLGTPAYLSPEQILGRPLDARADQFAFCVSLYEALYGVLPFAGENIFEYIKNAGSGQVRQPERGEIPGWVFEVLRRGLSPDAADRYRGMGELLREFDDHDSATTGGVRTTAAAVVLLGNAATALVIPHLPPPSYPRMLTVLCAAFLLTAILARIEATHRTRVNRQLLRVTALALFSSVSLAAGFYGLGIEAPIAFITMPLTWGLVVLSWALFVKPRAIPSGIAYIGAFALGQFSYEATAYGIAAAHCVTLYVVLRLSHDDDSQSDLEQAG